MVSSGRAISTAITRRHCDRCHWTVDFAVETVREVFDRLPICRSVARSTVVRIIVLFCVARNISREGEGRKTLE